MEPPPHLEEQLWSISATPGLWDRRRDDEDDNDDYGPRREMEEAGVASLLYTGAHTCRDEVTFKVITFYAFTFRFLPNISRCLSIKVAS